MNIYGLQKTTLLDYPEHVAATLFTGGCNFRCPYCHNLSLIHIWEPSVYIFRFIPFRLQSIILS